MFSVNSDKGREELLVPGRKVVECGRRMEFDCRLIYTFVYNMLQFCGHTWILTNTIVRFLTFGEDAMADTFHSVAFVMGLCQMFSILELFHISDGVEKAKLLPRFIHVTERNVIMVMLVMLEDMQSKPIVSMLFFSWNILDFLRYPYEVMCVISRPSFLMLWTRYTLWIPLYILTVALEGVTIYEAMPYFEPEVPCPPSRDSAALTDTYDPIDLVINLSLLVLGAIVTVWELVKERGYRLQRWRVKERRYQLQIWNKKLKKK